MDYKLEYMTRLFAKISKKKTESYVINRIWHQLNDDRVKFVAQQYIKRTQDKYALADLYLPQLNIFIEINEPFHKNNIEVDRIRKEEILQVTHSAFEVIDCDNSLVNIHDQIDKVVQKIRQSIIDLGDKFIPWEGGSSLSVEYHKNKGYLRVDDLEYTRTIDDTFNIFEAKANHRGFLRSATAFIPDVKNEIVWCPNSKNRNWSNELSEDGIEIREYNKNEQKRKVHVESELSKDQKRIIFFREEDELGFNFYRFVGVFKLDKIKSKDENKCVWKRISDNYQLKL